MSLVEYSINNLSPKDDTLLNGLRNVLEKIDRKTPGRSYRLAVLNELQSIGWSGKISLEQGSKSSIDGIKSGVGLVVQLGNQKSGLLSIMDLEYMYVKGKISSGVFITQTNAQAVQRNSIRNPDTTSNGNLISLERSILDLELYSEFLKCPLKIIAIDC